ncbi:MAG: hypothetical protein K5821_17020 [Nitrobacter sp.]|uniref:hypothetical protein n=1 Tax=Nitrobacter sp. TaxID=29420 RepID=UPI0026072C56|nr:hypothetical protein [Nitrobacter sp.]MCV0388050.1 hypothetical protein [Nitrobacter sp.]
MTRSEWVLCQDGCGRVRRALLKPDPDYPPGLCPRCSGDTCDCDHCIQDVVAGLKASQRRRDLGVMVVCGLVIVGFLLALTIDVLPKWFLFIMAVGVLATLYNGVQALRRR